MRVKIVISLALCSNIFANELSIITVEESKLITPTKQTNESVYTGSEITSKGIELQGAKALNSVYETIGILSGVNVENVDNSGLAIEQGSVRVRGVKSYLGALSVEGVPNYGGNPIGARDYLYDLENMEAISLYKGGIPADIGVGVGTRAGAIILHPKWANDKFEAKLSQTIGTNNYSKSYLRVDSGNLNSIGTKAFGAFSYAESDKWRGSGKLGDRVNGNIGLTQTFEKGSAKIWYNHNSQKQHLYRPLSYQQTLDLSKNYNYDYNNKLSGKDLEDIYYYENNRGEYKNDDVLSIINHKISENFEIIFKPYYSIEDSTISQGMIIQKEPRIQSRVRDIERYGAITEINIKVENSNIALGYHYESSNMDIKTKNYTLNRDYAGIGIVATAGDTYIHSPYAKFSTTYNDLNFQAGVKYFRFEDAKSLGYTTPSPTFKLTKASDLDREATNYTIWLPTVGLSYDVNSEFQIYANYGRNFVRPYSYLPLMNYYQNNKSSFKAIGMNAQNLFDGYDIEKSNDFDLGFKLLGENFEIKPTLFFGKHKNLLTTIANDKNSSLNYQQNVGNATSYGVEAEFNLFINDYLTLFVNPTYTEFKYDDNIKGMATKDNQLVDTPKFIGKAGVIYEFNNFEIIPMVRYLGERYGNAINSERLSSAWLGDLRATYNPNKSLQISLDINNLFDKKYISVINANDYETGSTTYQQGALRTIMLNMGLTF